MKSIRLFIQLSRPLYILLATLLYLLGAGIAHYINGQLNGTTLFLGLVWVILLLLGFQYLNDYFDISPLTADPGWWRTPFSGNTGALGLDKLPRPVALWAGLTCLTITASITVILIQTRILSPAALILLGVLLITELAFSLPPLHLAVSGYGELVMSVIRVGVIPAFAYVLQARDLHRLIIMVVFPLVILHLAMLLALELPSYATDIKYDRKSVIVRIGWQKGMVLHNLLILGSFVVFGLAFVLGLPLSVAWPVFFALPIGLVQVWMMTRIADGAKPNWNLLSLLALATFSVSAYLLTFTFWTH